jgi:hypothetical protein
MRDGESGRAGEDSAPEKVRFLMVGRLDRQHTRWTGLLYMTRRRGRRDYRPPGKASGRERILTELERARRMSLWIGIALISLTAVLVILTVNACGASPLPMDPHERSPSKRPVFS